MRLLSPGYRLAEVRRAALAGLTAAGATALATPSVAPLAAQPPTPRAHATLPVLSFPEAGLDDSAAYGAYQTRLFRDAADNTLQVYLDGRDGRVVHVLADAENESVAFTARDSSGRPAALRWGGAGAMVSPTTAVERAGHPATRTFTYRLIAESPRTRVGLFVLNSMRVEREFQDQKRQDASFDGPPYRVAEFDTLIDALAQLPAAEQRRQLALLDAPSVAALRARVQPVLTLHTPARAGAGERRATAPAAGASAARARASRSTRARSAPSAATASAPTRR